LHWVVSATADGSATPLEASLTMLVMPPPIASQQHSRRSRSACSPCRRPGTACRVDALPR